MLKYFRLKFTYSLQNMKMKILETELVDGAMSGELPYIG